MCQAAPSTKLVDPVAFFGLTFLLSWAVWIPLTLSHRLIGPFHIAEGTSQGVRLLGVLMPAAAALILTLRAGGRMAVRRLLHRLLVWRVGWRWWLSGVFVQPFLLITAGYAASALGWSPDLAPVAGLSVVTLLANTFFLFLATLGEEIGWRGLALPVLQEHGSPLGASLILGALVATWHVPFWLLFDTWDRHGVPYMVLNYVFVISMTIYISWLYNHGRQSLLLVAAFHVSFNIVNVALLNVTDSLGAFGLLVALESVIALLLIPALRGAGQPSSQLSTPGVSQLEQSPVR